MQSLNFYSLSHVYAPQTKISKNVDEEHVEIEIPLPVNLQGKYLVSTFHGAESNCYSFLIGRMNEIWSRTVAGFPFTPRISTLTYMGISLSNVCELLYSTTASWSKGPVPPLWVDLTCSAFALCSLGIVTYRSLQSYKIEEDPYKKIDQYLEWLKKNPYFLELWEKINLGGKLTFQVITKEEAEKTENYVSGAWYSVNEHTITLVREVDNFNFLNSIIFECCNAFQRQRFIKSHSKIGWENIPDRNKYGVFLEQLEYQSTIIYHKIVKYGVEKLEWNRTLLRSCVQECETPMSFEEVYLLTNNLLPEKKISHTENYRLRWDRIYAPTFFLKHSEELVKYPELLNYRSSPDNKSLLNLVVLDCIKLIRVGNAKTQEKSVIALTAFINRWYAQKERLNFQKNYESFLDSHLLFWGYIYIISSLQKNQAEAFESQLDTFLYGEEMKEIPSFNLDLHEINTCLLNHFDSLLQTIALKIREEHKSIHPEALTHFTLKPEEVSLLEDEMKKETIYVLSVRMLEILNSLSTLIQKGLGV